MLKIDQSTRGSSLLYLKGWMSCLGSGGHVYSLPWLNQSVKVYWVSQTSMGELAQSNTEYKTEQEAEWILKRTAGLSWLQTMYSFPVTGSPRIMATNKCKSSLYCDPIMYWNDCVVIVFYFSELLHCEIKIPVNTFNIKS